MIKRRIYGAVLTILYILLGVGISLGARREALTLEKLFPKAEGQQYDDLFQRITSTPAGEDGFTFAVLGDTRSNYKIALRVMTEAAKENPVFILHTGDVVREGRVEEYLAHHLPLVEAVAPIPVLPIPGNHEAGPNRDFAAFRKIYGGVQFSFDYGDCRFVAINNCDTWGLTRKHLRFLDEALSKPGAKHKFVMFHLPPRDLDVYVDTEEGRGFRKNSAALKELMEKHAVDHVFMGHVHGYATTTESGVPYTITGGGGANLAEQLDAAGSVHNYLVFHAGSEGVRGEVVRLVGEQWERSDL